MKKLKQLKIRVDELMQKRLDEVAKRKQMTASEIIRNAINREIDRMERNESVASVVLRKMRDGE